MRSQLTLRRRLHEWRRRLWLSAAFAQSGFRSEIAQTARCWRQTHRRRRPGNPNDRSKFPICLFMLARSQLTLRRQLRGWRRWRRSFKWYVADVKTIAGGSPAMTRIDRSSTIMKIYAYEIKQNLSKTSFCCIGHRYYDGIVHCFFPTIIRNGLCSHLQKIISRRPWPPLKNRDIHIEEFFL